MTSPDVLVIGAGVAGLSAAAALSARGARVLVLEAKAVLGGRATAFNDPQTGEPVDNGQHVLLGCYHETFSFLRTIGTEDRVRLQPNLDVEFVDRVGARSRLRLPPLPAPFNLLAGLFDWPAIGWRDRIAAMNMARPIAIAQKGLRAAGRGQTVTRIAASPGETVEQWLINNGQTARLREMLWEPLALAALNQSVREAAAPPFAMVLAEMFGGGPRDAALGLPACPLDELFAEPARSFIEARGGEVRIGCPARVVLSAGRVDHVEARGERLQAGAVVCAVPWYALADLFSGDTGPVDDLRKSAAATRPSPIASVNLWLDRCVLRAPFLGLPGRSMQWVFDKGQMFEGSTSLIRGPLAPQRGCRAGDPALPPGILAPLAGPQCPAPFRSFLTMVASAAEPVMGLSNEDLTGLALRELREAIPDARAAKVLRVSVVRERRATFSLAPGQPKRPSTRTSVERLVLAGDWIDTGLPATIESAAVSGRRAAESVS